MDYDDERPGYGQDNSSANYTTKISGEYIKVPAMSPWLLNFVLTIKRQVNRKRLTEKPCFMNPKMMMTYYHSSSLNVSCRFHLPDPSPFWLQCVTATSERLDRVIRLWETLRGYRWTIILLSESEYDASVDPFAPVLASEHQGMLEKPALFTSLESSTWSN